MNKRMSMISSFLCATILLWSLPLRADSDKVGLGVAAGASWPIASEAIQGGLDGVSFDWGFFVDIPLVAAYNNTPSAMLYKLKVNDQWRSVTDVDLNFKFIVPLPIVSIHAGVSAGLTSGADPDPNVLTAHGGLLAGGTFELVSNLEAFIMANYKVLFHDLEKVNDLHTYAGLMIRM